MSHQRLANQCFVSGRHFPHAQVGTSRDINASSLTVEHASSSSTCIPFTSLFGRNENQVGTNENQCGRNEIQFDINPLYPKFLILRISLKFFHSLLK